MLFVIQITLFYASLYKYSIRMIFANPDEDSHEPSESSYAPPSCAGAPEEETDARRLRTSQDSKASSRGLLANTACGSRATVEPCQWCENILKDYNGKVA
jgi:hypothetical protein